jgi:hypothetical protein
LATSQVPLATLSTVSQGGHDFSSILQHAENIAKNVLYALGTEVEKSFGEFGNEQNSPNVEAKKT